MNQLEENKKEIVEGILDLNKLQSQKMITFCKTLKNVMKRALENEPKQNDSFTFGYLVASLSYVINHQLEHEDEEKEIKCSHQGGFSDIIYTDKEITKYVCELCNEAITFLNSELPHIDFSKKSIKIKGLEKMKGLFVDKNKKPLVFVNEEKENGK